MYDSAAICHMLVLGSGEAITLHGTVRVFCMICYLYCCYFAFWNERGASIALFNEAQTGHVPGTRTVLCRSTTVVKITRATHTRQVRSGFSQLRKIAWRKKGGTNWVAGVE